MTEPTAVTDLNFEQVVLKSDKPMLVDFWATWCGPCRALAPVIEDLAKDYSKVVTFAKLNVDENPQTTAKYSIQSIPTLLLFSKGTVQEQIVGFRPKSELKAILDNALAESKKTPKEKKA